MLPKLSPDITRRGVVAKRGEGGVHTHTYKVLVECCLRLSRHHRIIKHLSEMLALNKHPCDELRAAPAAAPVVLFLLLFAITSE